MTQRQRECVGVAARRLKRDLDVRPIGARAAANKGGRFEHIARQRPTSCDSIFGEVPHRSRQRSPRQSVGGRIAHFQRDGHGRMVVIVSADAGKVGLDADTQ